MSRRSPAGLKWNSRDLERGAARGTSTQIAQAKADAEKVRIDIEAKARAEGLRITTIAEATAESIRRVNEAIQAGGEPYFRYRQIEMLPPRLLGHRMLLGWRKRRPRRRLPSRSPRRRGGR